MSLRASPGSSAPGPWLAGWLTIVPVPALVAAAARATVRRGPCACWPSWASRWDVTGQPPPQGPLLLVANHLSWLDILVMHAARHRRFVRRT
jgi:1-acyl-sn-glycerol-3-phosphate acyltransferase